MKVIKKIRTYNGYAFLLSAGFIIVKNIYNGECHIPRATRSDAAHVQNVAFHTFDANRLAQWLHI